VEFAGTPIEPSSMQKAKIVCSTLLSEFQEEMKAFFYSIWFPPYSLIVRSKFTMHIFFMCCSWEDLMDFHMLGLDGITKVSVFVTQ